MIQKLLYGVFPSFVADGVLRRWRAFYWWNKKRIKTIIGYVNFVVYMGGEHKHLFDEENILLILEEAGFSHVKWREFDPSTDRENRHHESKYAEGRK